MNKFFYVLLILFCFSCSKDSGELKYVDFERFRIKLPSNYNVESLGSIDSYAAKIELDWGTLSFDYGRYSPSLTLSPNEYLSSMKWEGSGEIPMFYLIEPRPIFENVVKIDSIYEATYNVSECMIMENCILFTSANLFSYDFELRDSTLIYRFALPEEIVESDFIISEKDSIYKKIVLPHDLNKNIAGVKMINQKSCIDEFNCIENLSIWTSDSIKINKEELIEILQSVEFK